MDDNRMAMMERGMTMMSMGKDTTAKGMGMMDNDKMDKGMAMTNKVADKMSKDSTSKDPMAKNPPMKDDDGHM